MKRKERSIEGSEMNRRAKDSEKVRCVKCLINIKYCTNHMTADSRGKSDEISATLR